MDKTENWSVRDDERPYLPPAGGAFPWAATLIVLAIAALVGYFAYRYLQAPEPRTAPVAAAPAPSAPQPQKDAEPAIRHPLDLAQAPPPAGLPSLENSDS